MRAAAPAARARRCMRDISCTGLTPPRARTAPPSIDGHTGLVTAAHIQAANSAPARQPWSWIGACGRQRCVLAFVAGPLRAPAFAPASMQHTRPLRSSRGPSVCSFASQGRRLPPSAVSNAPFAAGRHSCAPTFWWAGGGLGWLHHTAAAAGGPQQPCGVLPGEYARTFRPRQAC